MRSHSEYIPLTQDQIALAQHTDIVEYLRERGEKVQKEGNHYIWEKHDSCVIHGYKWYQNSTGKHGAADRSLLISLPLLPPNENQNPQT